RKPGGCGLGFLVLAFRGRGLGRGFYGGLFTRPIARIASMASAPLTNPPTEGPPAPESVQMPRPTAAPLVLGLGMVILAAGLPFGTGFLVVGAVVLVAGVSIWIAQLLPGQGHVHESLAEAARRPQAVIGAPGGVQRLQQGMP